MGRSKINLAEKKTLQTQHNQIKTMQVARIKTDIDVLGDIKK